MTFRVLDALPILCSAFGDTINKVPSGPRVGLENQKVMGFKAAKKVLALDVYPSSQGTVRMWIEPPAPPSIRDVIILTPKMSADLERRELRPLSSGTGVYLEVKSRSGLLALIDWYK